MKRVAMIMALMLAGCSAPGSDQAADKADENITALVSRCAFCHGPAGQSQYGLWPSLAGLDPGYIERQLDAFAGGPDGMRKGPQAGQMHILSARLSSAERRAIAAYYAALPPAPWTPPDGPVPARALHEQGSADIASCASCHGADGAGNAELGAPRIGGQPARYILSQLNAYASGARSDGNTGMAAVAKALTAPQREAIALYLQGDAFRDQ